MIVLPFSEACLSGAGGDIGRLLAFGALHHVELHLLAFLERFEPIHLDRAEVRKQIFSAVIWSDEPKAFCVVEPLDCTRRHTLAHPWIDIGFLNTAVAGSKTVPRHSTIF